MDTYYEKNQEIRRLSAIARCQDKASGIVHPVSLPSNKPKSIDLYGFPRAKNHKTGDTKPLCQFCGKKRTPRVDSKFCSRACYAKHVLNVNVPTDIVAQAKQCLVCSKELTLVQSKFCSQSCSGKGGQKFRAKTEFNTKKKDRDNNDKPILTEQEFAQIADVVRQEQIDHAKYLCKRYGRESARNYLLLVTNSDYWKSKRNSIIVEGKSSEST